MPTTDHRPWVSHYPQGVGVAVDVRFGTMLELWDHAVHEHGDAPCVYYFDAALTYRQIDDDSDALAAGLRERGLQAGERVGILIQNDPQWLITLLAIWKAGGIAVSLSPMLKQRELRFQLDDAGVSVLVCLEDLYQAAAKAAVADSGVHRVLTTHPHDWRGDDDMPRPMMGDSAGPGTESLRDVVDHHRGHRTERTGLRDDDVAVLMYTSGTTGPPKAAMLTHAGLCHNSQLVVEWFQLAAGEPVLGMAPLFHVTGLVMHLGVSWYAGAFDADEILTSIERRRPRFTIAAITAYLALLDHPEFSSFDLSSLRVAASGGAPVNLGVVNRFRAATGLTISAVYGLTETTSPSHLTPPGAAAPVDADSGVLTVGVPVPGAMAEVVDVDSGDPLSPGEVGEIVIRGPMVVPGYWRRPEESAAAIPGGRLFTGDVGFMNADGWFFVVDRKKDLIIASGYKVWPREVEEVLYEHPAVGGAAVVGEPDPYRGETVAAWVVPVHGATVDEQELISFCRERLAAYKYPRRVTIVGELPKTSTGKILRRALRGRTADGR
jgi:long-chain acyl-CoA synthetase